MKKKYNFGDVCFHKERRTMGTILRSGTKNDQEYVEIIWDVDGYSVSEVYTTPDDSILLYSSLTALEKELYDIN